MYDELDLTTLTRDAAEAVLRLAHRANAAKDIQWESSPRPRMVNEEGGKPSAHADPTFDIVTDERRIAVRNAMIAAMDQLAQATAAARAATQALENAIDEWEGN